MGYVDLSEATSSTEDAPSFPTLLLFAIPGRNLWVNLVLCFHSWKTEALEKCLPFLLEGLWSRTTTVVCPVAGNVRRGISLATEITKSQLSFCWIQRSCGWRDRGFAVQQGWLTAVQISGNSRQEIPSPHCLFSRTEFSVWVSCLTLWVACFLDVLKQMIWNRQNLAFSSCSCEGQEYCSSIVIYWNSHPFLN